MGCQAEYGSQRRKGTAKGRLRDGQGTVRNRLAATHDKRWGTPMLSAGGGCRYAKYVYDALALGTAGHIA